MTSAVYSNELQDLHEAGQITNVPYDPSVEVDIWDLGVNSSAVIWFVQKVGRYGTCNRLL